MPRIVQPVVAASAAAGDFVDRAASIPPTRSRGGHQIARLKRPLVAAGQLPKTTLGGIGMNARLGARLGAMELERLLRKPGDIFFRP